MPRAASPVTGRPAMQERQRRDRAAAPRLRDLLPDLASLQLDFEYSDRTEFTPSPQVTVFHPPARAYFCFACPYSDCDGEFDLAKAVTLMTSGREPNATGQLVCSGTRHRSTNCTLCLEFSLVAHYS